MIRYFLKKTGYGLLVLWGVITLIFFLFDVMPDPTRMILGQHTDALSISIVKKDLGLDQPVWKRYVNYLNDLSPLSVYSKEKNSFFFFDPQKYPSAYCLIDGRHKMLVLKTPYLRRSYQNKRKVTDIIGSTLFNTFILAFLSIAIASLAGIFLGIVSALKKDSFIDKSILIFSSLGMSLPSFFAAILIGWLFAYVLGNYTHLNLTGNLFEIDDLGNGTHLVLKNLILPTLTLAIRPLAVFSQLTRNAMLDTLSQDYIRTAFAKGLPFKTIIYRHALKNSLNPIVTTISGWFASLMAGVVFIEYIFGWKGLGYVIVDALNNYDMPVVMGVVLTISVIFVIINILVDIIYTFLDPRIKLST